MFIYSITLLGVAGQTFRSNSIWSNALLFVDAMPRKVHAVNKCRGRKGDYSLHPVIKDL